MWPPDEEITYFLGNMCQLSTQRKARVRSSIITDIRSVIGSAIRSAIGSAMESIIRSAMGSAIVSRIHFHWSLRTDNVTTKSLEIN